MECNSWLHLAKKIGEKLGVGTALFAVLKKGEALPPKFKEVSKLLPIIVLQHLDGADASEIVDTQIPLMTQHFPAAMAGMFSGEGGGTGAGFDGNPQDAAFSVVYQDQVYDSNLKTIGTVNDAGEIKVKKPLPPVEKPKPVVQANPVVAPVSPAEKAPQPPTHPSGLPYASVWPELGVPMQIAIPKQKNVTAKMLAEYSQDSLKQYAAMLARHAAYTYSLENVKKNPLYPNVNLYTHLGLTCTIFAKADKGVEFIECFDQKTAAFLNSMIASMKSGKSLVDAVAEIDPGVHMEKDNDHFALVFEQPGKEPFVVLDDDIASKPSVWETAPKSAYHRVKNLYDGVRASLQKNAERLVKDARNSSKALVKIRKTVQALNADFTAGTKTGGADPENFVMGKLGSYMLSRYDNPIHPNAYSMMGQDRRRAQNDLKRWLKKIKTVKREKNMAEMMKQIHETIKMGGSLSPAFMSAFNKQFPPLGTERFADLSMPELFYDYAVQHPDGYQELMGSLHAASEKILNTLSPRGK